MVDGIFAIELNWTFDSCGDPFMKINEDGIEVGFSIFLGDDEAYTDILSLLKKHNFEIDATGMSLEEVYTSIFACLSKQKMVDRIQLLDSIYNNAGWGTAYFKFKLFDYILYGSEKSITESHKQLKTVFRGGAGLYEEKRNKGERNLYLFVGHDQSLVIKTTKDFLSVHVVRRSEIM